MDTMSEVPPSERMSDREAKAISVLAKKTRGPLGLTEEQILTAQGLSTIITTDQLNELREYLEPKGVEVVVKPLSKVMAKKERPLEGGAEKETKGIGYDPHWLAELLDEIITRGLINSG